MSKLVRDEIPEIIKESGKLPIYHRAAPSEVEKLIWNFKELGEERFLMWYKSTKNKYLKPLYESGELKKEESKIFC